MRWRVPTTRGLGVVAVVFGLLLSYNFLSAPQYRIFGHTGSYLMFFGPLLLAAGVLLVITASRRTQVATSANTTPPASLTPESLPSGTGKTTLCVGLSLIAIPTFLLLVSAFSENYEELAGLLGTGAFFMFGLPGLAVTLFALIRARKT
jgi:hypothetical protein